MPKTIEALEMVRCGEGKAPPKEIEKLILEHCGPNGRFHPGGRYVNVPDKLADALVKAKLAKEA